MTGTRRTTAELPVERRRAHFRAWHRGTREMDLLLGTFADDALAGMDSADFQDFEALMEAPDGELFKWLLERDPVPGNYDTPVFRRLSRFHLERER